MPNPTTDAIYKAQTAHYQTFTPAERRILKALRNSRKFCVSAVALELHIATNTAQYHVDKIKQKTGFDPQTYDGLGACLEIMEQEELGRENLIDLPGRKPVNE